MTFIARMVPAMCSLLLSTLPIFSTAESNFPPPVLPPPLPMDRYQVDNGGDVCPSSVDMQALQGARQLTLQRYSALKEAESFEVYSAEMRKLWDVEDENIKIIIPLAGTYTGIEAVIEYITLVVGSINDGFAYYYDATTSNFEYFGTNSSYAFQVAQKSQFFCTVAPSASDPGNCETGEMDSLALHHLTWKPCSALISQYVIQYDDQQNYFATKGMTLPSTCNRHQRYCKGENQQYVDFIDCMSFMESIPSVSCANSIFNGDNAICRFKHGFMAQFNPDVHCPHLGKVTYACTDEDCGGDLTCDGKPGDLTHTSILPNACSKDTTKALVKVGDNGGNAFPLSRCEGDCDKDTDCQGDLVCFQREETEEVPGCSGQGTKGVDYCTVRPSDSYLMYKGNGKTNLGLCEGDCDRDADCATGFSCFRRRKFDPVPGCEGKGARGKDYCIPVEGI